MPVAENCCWPLGATVHVSGVTAIETRGLITVRVMVPVIVPVVVDTEAVILLVPAATPVASPEVLMVATDGVSDSQLADTALVLPSLYVPVALNCWLLPAVMDGFAGVMVIDCSVDVGGVVPPDPELPPQPTNRLTPNSKNDSSNRFIGTPRAFTPVVQLVSNANQLHP